MSGAEWAALVATGTAAATALGKGLWTVVRYYADRGEARATSYREESARTLSAKDGEIAALRQRVDRLERLLWERRPEAGR